MTQNNIQKVISAFFLLFLLYSSGEASVSTLPKADYVSTQEVKAWQKANKKFEFVDVRVPIEYNAGHLKDAMNIEYNKIESNLSRFGKNITYVFYCTYSAWRAPYAANSLKDHGYRQVYVLEGGISAWNAGGQIIYAANGNSDGYVAAYPAGMAKELSHDNDKVYQQKIYMTKEELSHYDGKDGNLAYVAVSGIIYDLTQSRLWRGGEHDPSKGRAVAGRDLTELLKDSPHGDKHLKDFPIVGYLK